MFDISDLLDYAQDDCVYEIYDCDKGETIALDLSKDEAEEWHNNHDYEFWSFEPIQRKDDRGETIFGIVFNVGKVEER